MAALTLQDIKRNLLTGKPRRRFIIPGVLPAGPCLLFGASGSGKTGLAIRTAVTVAAGLQWAGRTVDKGCVLYVAGEDFDGVQDRIVAATQFLDLGGDLPLAVMEGSPVGLVSDTFRNEIEREAGILKALFDLPISLIVIDTLAACFGPKSQDDATAASEYMNNADKLARRLGCAVLSIHHTGKNENSGMRGSRVFFDRADSVIEAKRGRGKSFLQVEKMRNGPGGARFSFEIDGIDVPTSDSVISVQVVRQLFAMDAIETPSREEMKEKARQNDTAAAHGLLLGLAVDGKASRQAWQQACYSLWENKPNNDARKNAFSKALRKLAAEGAIFVSGDIVTVTVTENSAFSHGYRPTPDTVTVTVPVSPLMGGRGDGRYRPDAQEQKGSDRTDRDEEEKRDVRQGEALHRRAGGETPAEDYCGAGYGYTGTEG
ncbi:AAA family ATPase [Sinorhizobium fredii]|uniref:AAA family ATPase n=1 Tax=Rhizobium fredii TaxID=380 RepID=UPI0004B587C8|nr:AAA family ATPase [Sinorhizobium fredii]AWI58997.1 hypothetical protein AB395_00003361 [Sinorhizobium fredii CCBAU 45436]